MFDHILQLLKIHDKIDKIKKEIDNITDINGKDVNGLSILHCFVQLTDVSISILEDVTDYLIYRGIDINILNYRYETPLIYACRLGIIDMGILFIQKGANVNMFDQERDSPLLWASYNNNIELVKFLIENGADINHKYRDDKNAFMWACKRGNYEIAEYLLNFSININDIDNCGNNAYSLSSNEKTDNIIVNWVFKNKLELILLFHYQKRRPLIENQLIDKIFNFYRPLKLDINKNPILQ